MSERHAAFWFAITNSSVWAASIGDWTFMVAGVWFVFAIVILITNSRIAEPNPLDSKREYKRGKGAT